MDRVCIENLNFINEIDIPTTEDFDIFFQMIRLFLEDDITNGRWIGLSHKNIASYNHSNGEVGIKIEFHSNDGKIIRVGVRFVIKNSSGIFNLFCISQPFNVLYSDKEYSNDEILNEKIIHIKNNFTDIYYSFVNFLDVIWIPICVLIQNKTLSIIEFEDFKTITFENLRDMVSIRNNKSINETPPF